MTRSRMIRFHLAMGLALGFLPSCKHEPVVLPASPGTGTGGGNGNGGGTGSVVCSPDTVYFQNEILPLFQSRCAMSGCHASSNPAEGINLTSYASIMSSGEIVPYDATEGDIMEVIQETDPDDIMPQPPNPPLTSAQITKLRTWINQGAPNNACDGCDTSTVTYSLAIAPLLQNHCAGCHNNTTQGGGVNLSSYGGVQTVALNGRLDGALNHRAGYVAMPQGGNKLSQCNLDKIRIWLDQGAPNN